MKYTNRLGLPAPWVIAVIARDRAYSKGDCDFSATELTDPALMIRLKRQFGAEVTVDVADKVWAVFGSAVHNELAQASQLGIDLDDLVAQGLIRADEVGFQVEERIFAQIDRWTISGQFDIWLPGAMTVADWKTTSSYAVKDGAKDEWEQQLNVLAWIHRKLGHQVERLTDIALLKDWTIGQRQKLGLPYAVHSMDVRLWPHDEAEAWILERCREIQAALDADSPDDVPECSNKLTWAKPDTWAIVKAGGTKALKLHYSESEALGHLARLQADAADVQIGKVKARKKTAPGDYSIEFRPGKRVRCGTSADGGYCDVADYCRWWQQHKAEQAAGDGE